MRENEIRIEVNCAARLLDGLIVLARQIQAPAETEIYAQRERVQVVGTLYFGKAFRRAAHRAEIQ